MKIRNIIFDFDGVLLDSVQVKTNAFRELFSHYPDDVVDEFIKYHLQNGGVSRYKKIRYFYENILGKGISEEEILKYANIYSELTKEELANRKYLISDSVGFVRNNYKKYNMHIASGADEQDLLYICDSLRLCEYFISINGSPTAKSEIIGNILNSCNYDKGETCLIGDSISDLKAAEYNGIIFFGYNCTDLKHLNQYIGTFDEFELRNADG